MNLELYFVWTNKKEENGDLNYNMITILENISTVLYETELQHILCFHVLDSEYEFRKLRTRTDSKYDSGGLTTLILPMIVVIIQLLSQRSMIPLL
jgi:hypothetical protein